MRGKLRKAVCSRQLGAHCAHWGRALNTSFRRYWAYNIVGAHETGPLIRSKDGFWLAIPTEGLMGPSPQWGGVCPSSGRGLRGGKITPGEWERRRGLRLRFVYRRRGPSLLMADRARINTRGQAVASRAKTGRNQVTAPIFLLVPQVKLPKRLDLAHRLINRIQMRDDASLMRAR